MRPLTSKTCTDAAQSRQSSLVLSLRPRHSGRNWLCQAGASQFGEFLPIRKRKRNEIGPNLDLSKEDAIQLQLEVWCYEAAVLGRFLPAGSARTCWLDAAGFEEQRYSVPRRWRGAAVQVNGWQKLLSQMFCQSCMQYMQPAPAAAGLQTWTPLHAAATSAGTWTWWGTLLCHCMIMPC